MASIAEIRQKYPQYEDMSDQQLADALHAKFYSDMPKAEFEQKIGLKPQVAPAPAGDIGDVLSAGFTSGVNAIPFVGPQIMGGLNQLKAAVHGVPVDEIARENAQLEAGNPIAAGIGSIAGPTVALAPMGMTSLGARALGLTGSIGSRIGLGAASGAAITGGDTLSRGGSINDAIVSGGIGGGVAGMLPIVGAGARGALNAVTGRTVPKAARNLGRALADDGIAPADINARLAAMGPDAMVMDLGPNLQRQAGAVASVPGAGQKTVREAVAGRAKGAPGRVQADVAATVGSGPELGTLREQVVAAQKAAADPLYAKVRDIPVQVPSSFLSIFKRPVVRDALRSAVRMAANDGYRFPETGNVLTVGLVDYMKRALDDVASSAAKAGNKNLARQAKDIAKMLVAETDKAVPEYAQARQAFAGPAQVLDAMDMGEAVFTKEMTPGQIKQTLQGMSASERDGFIQAARSSIEAQMGNAVNEALALRNMFKRGYNEQKLRVLLGNDVADDLLKRIDREATFGQTANVVSGNSETAARQAAQAEVAPDMNRTWRPDGVVGVLFAALDKARSVVSGTRQPKVNSQMAGLQTSRKVTPKQVRQLERAIRPLPTAILPPAVPALLSQEDRRKPIEITVRGGR